ncbi:unnamed protein product, partial [marine sediment metagenome]
FIQNNNLTWVDNLLTGSGKDMSNPNHEFYKKNVYGVREYIAKYGVRKCEANAIVIVPELGRKMLQDAVDEWLGKDAYKSYLSALETGQSRAKELIEDKLNNEYEEVKATEDKKPDSEYDNSLVYYVKIGGDDYLCGYSFFTR